MYDEGSDSRKGRSEPEWPVGRSSFILDETSLIRIETVLHC